MKSFDLWPFAASTATDLDQVKAQARDYLQHALATRLCVSAILADAYQCEPTTACVVARAAFVGELVKLSSIFDTLTKPNAPRAMLVSLDDQGQLKADSVNDGQSLVDIKHDLIDHLNSYPHSDEWITGLRDYCDGRLTARRKAKETGGLSLPMEDGNWDLVQTSTQAEGTQA